MKLFRTEALNAQQSRWLGEVVLIQPPSLIVLSITAGLAGALTLAFLVLGSYTQRTTVYGTLVPSAGRVDISAPQAGVVVSRTVQEGQSVKEGDTLCVISAERNSVTQGKVEAQVAREIDRRNQLLRGEIARVTELEHNEAISLRRKLDTLHRQLASLDHQILGQRRRAEIAQDTLARAEELQRLQFFGKDQVQQREAEAIEQEIRLQDLARSRLTALKDISETNDEIARLPLQTRSRITELERTLSINSQALGDSEANRELAISSPISGIAAAVLTTPGQAVSAGKTLLTVIPAASPLQAELQAPSRAVGFVTPGDVVLLRYHAYPYEKFGQGRGRVRSISRTTIPVEAQMQPASGATYRIVVELASQSISANGKSMPLQPGMTLDADILQEKRRLYEWVLAPLFRLSGTIK